MFRRMAGGSPAPRRRDEALAYIIERISRGCACPSGPEIARALHVSDTRAKQLVAQLIREGVIEKTPGAQRSLRVRDVAAAREQLGTVLSRLGWTAAVPMGVLSSPFPQKQLPMLPPLEHLPDE